MKALRMVVIGLVVAMPVVGFSGSIPKKVERKFLLKENIIESVIAKKGKGHPPLTCRTVERLCIHRELGRYNISEIRPFSPLELSERESSAVPSGAVGRINNCIEDRDDQTRESDCEHICSRDGKTSISPDIYLEFAPSGNNFMYNADCCEDARNCIELTCKNSFPTGWFELADGDNELNFCYDELVYSFPIQDVDVWSNGCAYFEPAFGSTVALESSTMSVCDHSSFSDEICVEIVADEEGCRARVVMH